MPVTNRGIVACNQIVCLDKLTDSLQVAQVKNANIFFSSTAIMIGTHFVLQNEPIESCAILRFFLISGLFLSNVESKMLQFILFSAGLCCFPTFTRYSGFF